MFFKKRDKSRTETGRERPKNGLRSRIRTLFASETERLEERYEELEDTLVEGDIAPSLAAGLCGELRSMRLKSGDEVGRELRVLLKNRLRRIEPKINPERLTIYLLLGVNGVGKTTTIARMVRYYGRDYGVERFVLGAADTFRAAAVDQLKLHAERLGVRIVAQSQGSDPGSVVYDTVESAAARGDQLALIDTAGRMHTRDDLVKELGKISGIVAKKAPQADYRKILVLDATTGANALHQAETFHEAVGVDSVVLAKSDSSGCGGFALSVCDRLDLPFIFMGRGEGLDDLIPFDKELFLDELLGD